MAVMATPNQQKYPYPSRFGSHKSMVVKEDGEFVFCEDEFGQYKTLKNRLDNGCADPFRYAEERIQKLFQGKEKPEEKR